MADQKTADEEIHWLSFFMPGHALFHVYSAQATSRLIIAKILLSVYNGDRHLPVLPDFEKMGNKIRLREKADGHQKENKKIMNGGIFEDAKG